MRLLSSSLDGVGLIKVLLCTALIFGLTACTSTTVHLNTRYISNVEADKLVTNIEATGMNVVANKHEFPQSIQHSTLLYSPLISDKQALDKLMQVLDESDWRVHSLQPLMANNHWFKKNSVGLYLLPDNVVPQNRQAKADLATQYTSHDCEQDISLTLSDNGDYQFTFSHPPENASAFSFGRWRVTEYPYIELVTADRMRSFYFEVKQLVEEDKISQIQVTRLHPMNQHLHLAKCKFEFGIRL